MNKTLALVLLELRSLFGINRFLHIRDKKAKKRYIAFLVTWVFLILAGFFTVGLIVYGLVNLGLAEIVPAYLILLSSILILVFGIFSAGNRIFGQKGYDILAAMPVKSGSIVLARFLGLYIGDLILTLVITIPGIVMYGILMQPPIWFYLIVLVGTLLIPAIPLTISTLFGTLLLATSSRTKNKNIVQTVLSILITIILVVISSLVQGLVKNLGPEQLFQFAQMIGDSFRQIYPPAMWLGEAMIRADIIGLLLFVIVSVGVTGLAVLIAARNFNSILWRLSNFTAKHNYEIRALKERSILGALYFRELKRYFSSSVYTVNTILGPIFGATAMVILCVIGIEQIRSVIPIDVASFLPFVFAGILTMMTSSSVAISMEGKQIWISKSLPIPMRKWLLSKILLNLSLMSPFYLVGIISMIVMVQPSILQLIWIILIPILLMLFAIVFGITINLKSHRFDWERDEMVVKQSLSAVVGGFVGPLVSILLGVTVFFVPVEYDNLVKLMICLGLIVLTIYLYRRNNQKKMVDL